MNKYVNISELAEQVLADVSASSVIKTAAEAPVVRIPAARELKKFAEDLRAMAGASDEPTDDDLAALMQDQEVQDLLQALEENPELLQQLLAEDEGAEAPEEEMAESPDQQMAEGEDPEMQAAMAGQNGQPPQPPSKMGSVSLELRKIAALLRQNNPKEKYIRRIKAAQMLQAATSIKHLTGV